MSNMDRHVLITGGAGYIGSLLTTELLRSNFRVTVADSLLFGGNTRDTTVSFAKSKRELGFEMRLDVFDDIRQLLLLSLKTGLIAIRSIRDIGTRSK